MKKFYKCDLPDLLLDEDFQYSVWESEKGNSKWWDELLLLNPGEASVMRQGRELLLALGKKSSSLTPEELSTEVEAILAHTRVPKKELVNVRQMGWLSLAASILLLIGVFVYSSKNEQSAYSYRDTIAKVTTPLREVINETAGEKRVKLSDGSVVVLSPAGKISYTEPFVQNHRREIYLSGDAFFEIQKDSLNPLFVYANGLVTRVVGTSFLIKTTESDVKVLVRTGRVAVTPFGDWENPSEKSTELMLIPNQQALYSMKDKAIRKTIIDFPDEPRVMKNETAMVFDNQSVPEVFEVLEKVYGIPFVYDRAVMAKCLLRVEFTNESLFAKLDIITHTIGATYSVVDGRVIISGKGCN